MTRVIRSKRKTGDRKIMRRHHYVPQFYLRNWVGGKNNKLFIYYKDRNGNVRERYQSPKSTAYGKDLYILKKERIFSSVIEPDQIEKQFFQKLDNAASNVLKKILTAGIDFLRYEDKELWAYFILSLLERNIQRINSVDKFTIKSLDQIGNELLASCRDKESAANVERVIELFKDEDAAHNIVQNNMLRLINDPDFVTGLLNMSWKIIYIESYELSFITTDYPVLINYGKDNEPIQWIAMPLSPNNLFVIYPSSWEWTDEFVKLICFGFNLRMIENCSKYVYARHPLKDGQYHKYTKILHDLLPAYKVEAEYG